MIHNHLTVLPLLLLLTLVPQQDSIRHHYETAEAYRRAGNLPAAEAEYSAILSEGYAKLGKIYLAQEDYKRAINALEAGTSYRSSSEEPLIDLAIAYFDTEQYQKSIEALGQALARNPRSAAAHHMLGKSYFMLTDFDKARLELETALKIAPNDHDVEYTLGLVYLKQHQLAPAKQIYDRMLEGLGDHPQLHIIFGRAYRETDFLPEAIEEFKKAIVLDAKFPRAHYYLGLTYLLKDGAVKLNEATAEFKIELAQHPDEFFANYYLGVLYTIDRKWDEAITLLRKASAVQPENPDPYFHLGQAYQAIARHDLAIEALQKTIALTQTISHNDYQVTTAHFRLGQSLIKAGFKEQGEKELQVAADLKLKSKKRDEEKTEFFLSNANLQEQNKQFPELQQIGGVRADANAPDQKAAVDLKSGETYYTQVVASAHNNIGLLRAQQQDFRGAATQFALAANWNSQLEQVNFNQGLACFKAELYKDAVSPLEKELKVNSTNQAAKQLLGLSYFMLEQYEKASPLLQEVAAVRPDVGVYYALAFSLLKQDRKAQADQAIQQMVALSGNTPQLHVLLSQAFYQEGDSAKALGELKTAETLDPKFRLAHYYAGLIYLKLGKFNEAAQEFNSELLLNPADIRAKYHLAYVLLANQNTDRGVELMKEVIADKPDYAEAHYELGKALLSKDQVQAAVEQLEIALKLQPDRSYVHYQLGRAYLALGRKSDGENQLEIARQLKEKEREQTKP